MRRGGGGGGDRNRRGQQKGNQGPPIYYLPERVQALFAPRPPLQPWPRYTAEGDLIVEEVAAAESAAAPPLGSSANPGSNALIGGIGQGLAGGSDGVDGAAAAGSGEGDACGSEEAPGAEGSAEAPSAPAVQLQQQQASAAAPAAGAASTAEVPQEALQKQPPLPEEEEGEPRPHSFLEGVAGLVGEFETSPPPAPPAPPQGVAERRERRRLARMQANYAALDAAAAAWNPKTDPSITGNALATLFVGRLPKDITDRKLAMHFKDIGKIKDLRIVRDKKDRPRCYAFVEFENEADVKVRPPLPVSPAILFPPPPLLLLLLLLRPLYTTTPHTPTPAHSNSPPLPPATHPFSLSLSLSLFSGPPLQLRARADCLPALRGPENRRQARSSGRGAGAHREGLQAPAPGGGAGGGGARLQAPRPPRG
jgi:hypothetical protein